MSDSENRRILIAPLNWGLGHATRCIPLIRYLDESGYRVVIASSSAALRLLRAEFPHLLFEELPSYHIKYRHVNIWRNIIPKLPHILWAIWREHRAMRRIARERGICGVISDNRYGCFVPGIPSVILCHQLNLPLKPRFLAWIADQFHRLALSRFSEIWVPDFEGANNLSGDLSHSGRLRKVKFIGILSRMKRRESEQEYDVAIVLSGPEPQRSILEHMLVEQAIALPGRSIIIQGKTRARQQYFVEDHVEMASYFTSDELNDCLAASGVVVCRSGYSSIMDLAALGKKALLIPTPGQSEQEYLARYLSQKSGFVWQEQSQLNLSEGLKLVAELPALNPEDYPTDYFKQTLSEWLSRL